MNALIEQNNILATLNVKKPAASFVFTSKIGLPRVVPVLQWVLFVRQIFVSPHSEFEQHMYSSDPSSDTVSFMQLESRRVPHRLHSPRPKPQGGHLILQLDGREVEIHCRLPDHAHFFHFLVF